PCAFFKHVKAQMTRMLNSLFAYPDLVKRSRNCDVWGKVNNAQERPAMKISRRTMLGSAGAVLANNVLSAHADTPLKEIEMTQILNMPVAPLPFAMTTPVRVSRIGLKARDAESLAE